VKAWLDIYILSQGKCDIEIVFDLKREESNYFWIWYLLRHPKYWKQKWRWSSSRYSGRIYIFCLIIDFSLYMQNVTYMPEYADLVRLVELLARSQCRQSIYRLIKKKLTELSDSFDATEWSICLISIVDT